MKEAIGLLHAFAQNLNPQIGTHMKKTAQLARRVAEAYQLDQYACDHITMAGLIHDIGLLALPKDLQTKDVTLLSDAQLRDYYEHPLAAAITLEQMPETAPVGEIVLYHHEYMNGQGFPNGLSGSEIPLASRILLVASDYSRVVTTWPRDMRKVISYVRRHLDGDDYKRFTFSDDPEQIIEESAAKILLKDPDEKYDVEVVNTLIRVVNRAKNIDPTSMLDIERLKPGMTLMEDVRTQAGRLLLTKDTQLNDAAIRSLQSIHAQGLLGARVYVAVPEP